MALKINRGTTEPGQLKAGEPFLHNEKLLIGNNEETENIEVGKHPESHPASMITETETLKVMTVAEREAIVNIAAQLVGIAEILESI
jgi:hypothetical protein